MEVHCLLTKDPPSLHPPPSPPPPPPSLSVTMMFTLILGGVAGAEVAAPAAPSALRNVSTCSEELEKFCGSSRKTHETCIGCTTAHESDLDKVHCSYYDIERFCGEIPPPPPLPGKNCSASEYCCPDAVHCLTPIR